MASNRRKKPTVRSSKRKRDTAPVRAQDPTATTAGSDDQQFIVSASISTVEDAESSNSNDTTDTCPFLEMPPEIRNIIYSYALPGLEDCHSRNVANFRFPPITRISKQVRHESLPVLFAQCNFQFCIGANLITRSREVYYSGMKAGNFITRPHEVWYSGIEAEMRRSGTFAFKHVVQQYIVDAGDLALFKDVSLRMYMRQVAKHVRYAPDLDDPQSEAMEDLIAILHLTVEGSTLHCRSDFPYRPWRLNDPEHIAEAVEDTLKDAERVAKAIAARDGFAGFTIQNLKRVAASYRYRRPGKRDPVLD